MQLRGEQLLIGQEVELRNSGPIGMSACFSYIVADSKPNTNNNHLPSSYGFFSARNQGAERGEYCPYPQVSFPTLFSTFSEFVLLHASLVLWQNRLCQECLLKGQQNLWLDPFKLFHDWELPSSGNW